MDLSSSGTDNVISETSTPAVQALNAPFYVVVWRALRVYQWSKNLLVFAALVFAHQLGQSHQIFLSVLAFFAFCAASSAMYLFNDIIDVKKDRSHPVKCKRPIASGALSIPWAIGLMVLMVGASVVLAYWVGLGFLGMVLFYIAMTIAYTVSLKHMLIIDILIVALGFVVRAMAGAVALHVGFSNWLVVCTLFLALFLALSKRRHEVNLLTSDAAHHRTVLGEYTVAYLDSMILIVAGATLITYTIYTCSPEVVARIGTDKLYFTLPLVVYGLFRYLYLIHLKLGGGDPSRTLIKDKHLAVTVLAWAVLCIAIIYWGELF